MSAVVGSFASDVLHVLHYLFFSNVSIWHGYLTLFFLKSIDSFPFSYIICYLPKSDDE
jgi:hypothetical protein